MSDTAKVLDLEASADRDALERLTSEAERVESGGDMEQGKILREVAATFDPTTGEVPWEGGGIKDGRIVSIEGLDRMGDHLVAYERGIAQNQRLHDAAVKRLEERLERTQAPLRREVARIRAMVEAFAQEQGRKGICIGRLKSRTFPSGLRLAWREREKGEYRMDQRPDPATGKPPTPAQNRERLLAWAKEEEARRSDWRAWPRLAVPGPEVADLAAIKAYLAEIGADKMPQMPPPPGLEYVPPGETLTVGVETKEEP